MPTGPSLAFHRDMVAAIGDCRQRHLRERGRKETTCDPPFPTRRAVPLHRSSSIRPDLMRITANRQEQRHTYKAWRRHQRKQPCTETLGARKHRAKLAAPTAPPKWKKSERHTIYTPEHPMAEMSPDENAIPSNSAPNTSPARHADSGASGPATPLDMMPIAAAAPQNIIAPTACTDILSSNQACAEPHNRACAEQRLELERSIGCDAV